MRKTISEMAKLSGVTVRTLHYYDEIGLLVPSEVISETGYRYYDEEALVRLQQILFYKELDFSLKEIVEIMDAPEYNKEDALLKQRKLLILKRDRLDHLIKLISENLEGEIKMSFKEFDTKEIDLAKKQYAREVKERWGHSSAYEQSKKKTASYTKENWEMASTQMDNLMKQFAALRGECPTSEKVQKLVEEWKQYITDTWYDCTNEILAGLGQMYSADERFTKNIDKFGEGTARLMSEAIEIYCKR